MVQGIQKIVKIGSTGSLTIQAKELEHQNIAFGDEVEVIVRLLHSREDQRVVEAAKEILKSYKQDFENLAMRRHLIV
jgi:hypothetical protein